MSEKYDVWAGNNRACSVLAREVIIIRLQSVYRQTLPIFVIGIVCSVYVYVLCSIHTMIILSTYERIFFKYRDTTPRTSKLLCFTRSSSLIYQLPAQYPNKLYEKQNCNDIKQNLKVRVNEKLVCLIH